MNRNSSVIGERNIINIVAPSERATAIGLSVFFMHFFGDIPSPPLVGALSDASSLQQAFLIVPIAIAVAALPAWRAYWLA